jgi:transposase, IS30 family
MSYQHLTPFERGQIQLLHEQGKGRRAIARVLGRDPSTILRELRRNCGPAKRYVADQAQKRYHDARKECVKKQRLEYRPLWDLMFRNIPKGMTPEQIAGRLPLEHPNDPRMRISYETIYRALYTNQRLQPLIQYLPQARPKRRKKGMRKSSRGPSIPNRVPIDERPPEVNERVHCGHWEGDTVLGKNQRGAILTLVERKTLFLAARRLDSKNADLAATGIIEALIDLPAKCVKTITFDNGTEFARHHIAAQELNVNTYFAHPYCSNERARNENTNGLLRRFLPKGTSFEHHSQAQLDYLVYLINNRPRKTLGYRTPHELFYNEQTVALET